MAFKNYSDLIKLSTFKERYNYLKLNGQVGKETFGFQRWINQELYHSAQWRSFRDSIIIRDNGCDLAVEGFDIHGSIIIHHINIITPDDIINNKPTVFDPENVISTQMKTHNAIHYGDESLIFTEIIERTTNDTCPWK